MSLEKGCVVRSKAGRDKDRFMVVVAWEEGFAHLCDGKERPLQRPKRKNIKHLAMTRILLNEDQMATNRALRKSLFSLNEKDETVVKGEFSCQNRI